MTARKLDVAAKRVASLTIDAPMTLPNPTNLREHWAAKARRVKAQRLSVALLLRANGVGWRLRQLVAGERLAVRLTRIAPRQLDDDGNVAAFKAVRDEVAEFFGINDASPLIRFEYAQAKGKPSAVRIDFAIEPRRDMRAIAERNGAKAHADIEAALLAYGGGE